MFYCFDIFMFKLTKCEISPNSGDKTRKINKNVTRYRFTSIKRPTLYCLGRRGLEVYRPSSSNLRDLDNKQSNILLPQTAIDKLVFMRRLIFVFFRQGKCTNFQVRLTVYLFD